MNGIDLIAEWLMGAGWDHKLCIDLYNGKNEIYLGRDRFNVKKVRMFITNNKYPTRVMLKWGDYKHKIRILDLVDPEFFLQLNTLLEELALDDRT